MQTEEDPELTIEVDADGFRVDHRSETEQSSQSKEVHEYPDRTEIRLRDEKEVRLEEVKTRETTRRATYDDIIALLDAQLEGLDEIQTSREVTIQEFNRVETTRETVTDGELKREIRTTDEKRKEEILEGPSNTTRVVTTETETLVVQPSPGALSLTETESPLSQISDNAESSSEHPHGIVIDSGLRTEPVRVGFNVGITPGEADFRIRSEGVGGKTPEKSEGGVVWVPKHSADERGYLGVPGELNLAENTGSLHRIQHRAHRIEELIVEDVDTFYEDQSKPAKRLSGLLGVKRDKRGKSQSPSSTLEKRPKTETTKGSAMKEERMTIEVANVTPVPAPERPAQPSGVDIISAVPRTDIVIQPDIQVESSLGVRPRDVVVDPQDGNTNRITYVVSYDSPGGVNIRDSGKRKKDVHPKKKKDKRRLGKQQSETEHVMPAETEFVTYVVNYDRTEPLDGDNKSPRPTVFARPEGSFQEPSISKQPRDTGNATIEVDMNAGDVKVMEPIKVLDERQGASKTFVVNYEVPEVEKSPRPSKPKKELKEVRVPHAGRRQPPSDEFTYIVNYDQPSVTPIVPPTAIGTTVESPDIDSDLEKKAPVYSITVVEPGPGVFVEKARKSPEKPTKKQDGGNKDGIELTYIVNYDEPRQGSLDDTDNFPRKDGGGDVWIRPLKPTFEAKVRGKEEIKAKPAKHVPGNTEPLTFVVEYERGGAEEKAKGGIPVPKLKKGGSSDNVVEKMYTYIVNYDQPSSRLGKKQKKTKKEDKKGKAVKAPLKAEGPHLQKSYDIERPSPELSFTVQHPFPEPVTQPKKPTSELSIEVRHPVPEPAFEIREESPEYSITIDHPFPEPFTKPQGRFEEFSIAVDHQFPEPVTKPEGRFEEFSIAVDHPFPEPVTKPEGRFEEFSIAVDHPFPEPVTKPEGRFEEFSIAVDHPFPEPVTKPEGRFEEFSIAVDHPFPEPVTKPEGRFEEFSIAVDHPFPEPVTKPQGRFEEFSIAVDHPFPEPVTKPEGRFEEFSIAVDHPFPEPATQPDEQFEEFFFAVDHPFPEPATPPEEQFEEFFNAVDQPFPEPVTKPQEQFEEFSITVDHPIPEAHLEIKEPVLPHPKLPKLVPSKDSGESLTYVVTYNTPTVSREAKPTKTEKKRKPLFSKGSKPPIKDKVATEATQEVAQTFTYIVNYDEPSIRPEHRDVPKPAKAELFGKVDVKASKPETETSAKIPGPKETVGQSEALSITVSQPTPTISRAIPDIAPSESAEGVTYIVNYDEPFSVGLVGEKQKKIPRKKAEMKKTKPAEPEYQIGVLPEESAMPQPASSLTIVVEHPEPKAALVTGDIPSKVSSTAETLTYVVNYDQPIGEKEKVRDAKGKHGWQKDIEGKKPWAAVEADTRKVVVKTPEPAIIITPVVPKPPSVNESISFTVVHDQPELPEARSAIVTDSQWKPESSEERTFIVNYNLPSKTEQDVEAPEIEFEAPATIEISQSTEYVSLDLKDIEPPSPTIAELQRDISGNIESPAIPVPALTIPKTAGESVTYIVQYEEPLVKTIGSGKPAKEKRQKKGRTFPKKKQSAGADVEIEGAPLPTTRYEVTVTTDQPKSTVSAEVPKRKPLEALTTTPVVAMPKQIDVATEQVTYVVNYDRSHKVILIPEVRDSAAIEVEAEDIPQIEPFEIPEPEVEIEEPNSRLTITVEEPLPDVSAEIEPPSSEIVFKVKEPVAPVITIPDVAFPRAGTAETITYVVTHEEPAPKISGKVKPDKKEKKRGLAFPGKKYSKDIKAGASFEANRPEAAAEVAGGFPLYEVTVKTEQQEPSVDVKKKKREVPVTTPEAVISITKPSGDVDVQAQTQPQSIIYVVNYDESQKVVAKPKIKETANIKEKAIAAVKPSKAPKGKLSSGDGESITYVVTYDDEGKSVPPPKIKGLEVLKVEVQDIHEIKAPEIPQATLDIEEPSLELTITVEQPLPEISAEVKPPTPKIKVKEPFEVEEFTITVDQTLPEVSTEVKLPTSELKVKKPTEVEQLTITVEQPLPEVSTEVKHPTPELKVKMPAKAVVTSPSVDLPQADTLQTFTYVVTHDESAFKISGENKPEKQRKKQKGFSFPGKKISKEPRVEGPSLSDVESLTYVVTYDDSGNVSPPKIKEHAEIKIKTKDIPPVIPPEIPEAEVKLEEPRSQLTISVEHPLPEVGADVKAATPETKIKGPPEFVVKPPSVVIPKAGAAETITYIVTHEEPAFKTTVEVESEKREKKKRGLVFPGKKLSKDVKAGAGVTAEEGPEVNAELAEGVPVYEVSVTTEQLEPAVHAKKKKKQPFQLNVTTSESDVSITKPSADIAANAQLQSQSVTYVVTYDDTEKAIPPPAKKNQAIVEAKTEDVSKITIPTIPEHKLEFKEPSSQLTITVEQPLPEIAADIKTPTPEIKESSEVERLTITGEQPTPVIGVDVQQPAVDINIREPSDVEQLEITVEQPFPEKVKPQIPELKVKQPSEVVVGPPASELTKGGTAETITYIVNHEEVVEPDKKKIRFPGKHFGKTSKIGAEAKEPEMSDVKTGKEKPQPLAKVKATKPAIYLSPGEVLTYVVTYDDSSTVVPTTEIKAPAIPESKFKAEEPNSQLTITVEQPITEISTEVKPPTPEIKIREPPEVEQLTITVEQPVLEISAEVKPPTPDIKMKGPSEVEQLKITVEQPLTEISAEVKPPNPKAKAKVPSKIAGKPPSVDLPKAGTTETITYIVNNEEPTVKVSDEVKPETKEKKKNIRFPAMHFGKTYKYEVSGEGRNESDSDVKRKEDKSKSKVNIKAKKPAIDLSPGEVVTYVVTYDDLSKVVPTTELKAPEIPEPRFKAEEPNSQLTITVEQPITEISAEVKPPTPEVKIREPFGVEQLSITLEQPAPEISAEVKPPTPEIKIKGPSEVEQLRITVEQPLPQVSAEEKLTTPETKFKAPSEIAVKPPVDLLKAGTTETITYVVNHEEPTVKVSGEVKPEKKEKKIRFPAMHFGKTHKYKVSGEGGNESEDYDVKRREQKPKPQANIKAKKPAIDLSPGEVVTYVVTYDDSSKVAPTTEIKAPEIPESRFKVDEPNSQLTITIEQPITEISAEVKPPTPEIKIREPFGVEQLSITVEQPVPEISAEVKPPSPEIKIRELPGVEQLSITVEHPVPEISAEVKPPTPEIKIRELPGVEQLTITVEQPVPEVNAEVKPPIPEIKIKGPSEVEQLRITVEQPLPEISAEAKLPTPEAKVKAPSKIAVKPPSVVLPKAGTTETITYIVNNEGPAVKVSGEVKPEKREKKQLGIRVPGKKVTKELKADAGIAAKGPTADVIGEVPVYEVTVTTEQPTLPVAAVSGTKDAVAQKDAVETVTYVVEREEEPHPRETISAEGRKKRKDWIWRVKKPAKSIDISSESQEREAVRIEHESGMSAKIGEPKLGISAETEAPKRDISISTEKAKVAQEVSQSPGVPETHTYVVTYNEPQATTSKGKLKLWPFSRKAKPGKLDVKPKPMKNKWTPFKKKQLKVVKPRVDVELSEMKSRDITVGEAVEGDIDVNVPSAPSIALEQKETIAGDVSRTVEMPAAPEFSIPIFREEEPPAESVIAPHPSLIIPEAGETDLETREAQKPTDFSQLKFDVEAKLPGRKEQVLAEKVISGKVKVADAEAERTEPKDKDRTVIAGGRREEENAEEETVVYIVNYEQPFGTLTKTKDGAKEAPGGLKPSSETEVAVDKQPDVTNIKHSVQVQMPQLEQCILVPIRDEGSPEDSFYGTEAPVPDWPPIDEPHFEEDIRPDVGRKFETSAVDEKQLPPHLVVVAVDFGTTFSGYAFSFSRDSAGSIHVMRKWEGGDPGAVDHKTPTILLLTPGGQFHSFGFTARDFYHDLSPKEAARWLYFEKFKMALHFNDELNTDTKLAAANGHCVPAIDVFTHALRFFRKHVLQEISDQVSTDVLNEDIYWIITVPAIWTEEAKQFMRLAAYRAGIASPKYPDQLLISLEPEAASIYVRKQRLHQLVPEVPFQRRRSSSRRSMTPEPTAVNQPIVASERKVLPSDSGQLVRKTTTVTVSWPVVTTIPQTDITVGHQVDTAGTRYMVVDCGGGTVDITVHEIQSRDGTLRELHRATGGPFGSVAVDQEFEKLLVEIFGVDFINVFKAKRPAGWVDLLMAFESRKRAANPYITKPLNVSLPFSFIDYHKKYRNCPVEHAIRKYGNRDIRWSSQGMLRLMPDAMNRLFLPAIDKIKEAIGNLLNDSDVKGLRFLFLVGGFADSPMLQMAIRQEFGHLLKIIIPNDASISILKGAVCFGLDPTVITTRKSRMTYGVGVLNRFVHGQHPPSKLVLKDGEEWCTDVFDALVYADQSVAIGDTVLRRYTLVPGDADDVTVSKVVNIYSSDRRNVEYVSERGVTRCGTLCLTDDDGGKRPSASRQDKNDREVQVRMTFGHTEIKVTAFELGTRKSVRATIDFLNK